MISSARDNIDRYPPDPDPPRAGDFFHRSVFERRVRQRNGPSPLEHPFAQILVANTTTGNDTAIWPCIAGDTMHEIAGDLEIQRQYCSRPAGNRPDEGVARLFSRGNVNAVKANERIADPERTIFLHECKTGNLRLRHCPMRCHRCAQRGNHHLEQILASPHFSSATANANNRPTARLMLRRYLNK